MQDEFARRFGRAGVAASLLAGLFPEQLALVNDPSVRKAALCGRRAGKTTGMASYLVKVAEENPECVVAYIALSRSSAKRLMWPILKRLDRQHKLEIDFNSTELTATLPNGSLIWLTGANDEDDIDKLRGDKYKLVVLDECASFGAHLNALIEEVLDPAVSEVGGTIVMTGSPSAICVGAFYEATLTVGLNGEWSAHHWTMLENPMYEAWRGKEDWRSRAKVALDAKRAKKGWSETNPIFLREWMGEWVASDSGLVYHFNADRNTYTKLPDGFEFSDFNYILGIDLGYRDPTAFVVLAYAEDLPDLYVVYEFSKSGMVPSEVEAKIRELDSTYHFVRMVADTGGLGKSIVEGFTRKGLPVIAAEKVRKFEFIEMVNGDMIDGHIKAPPDSELVKQWKSVRIEDGRLEDGPRGGMGYKPKEDYRDPNDLCLVAGTLVRTEHGERPIESIRVGDKVWTRRGLRAVYAAGQTGSLPTHEVETVDGRKLRGTAGHPVFANGAWTRLADLTPNDTLIAWASTGRWSGLFTKAFRFAGILGRNLGLTGSTSCPSEVGVFTGPSGRMLTGLFRKSITSTTRTKTRSTTPSRTSNVYPAASTSAATCASQPWSPNQGHQSRSLAWLRLCGTALLPGWRGTPSTPRKSLPTSSMLSGLASCAAECFWPSVGPMFAGAAAPHGSGETAARTTSILFAQSAAERSAATATPSQAVAPVRVLRAAPTGREESVYNLSVEGEPEYFANGILVHNCDAFTYGFREAYHWLYRAPPPPPPPVDTDAYYAMTAAAMRKAALDRADRRKRSGEDVLWEEKS